MPEPLIASRLLEPKLRFDAEDRLAVGSDPYRGLQSFGPYDAGERRRRHQKVVRAVIVGQTQRVADMQNAKAALCTKPLRKLHECFEIQFVGEILVPPSTVNGEARAYREAVQQWLMEGPEKRNVDLAFVLHGDELMYKHASPYYATKAVFLREGVPTQSICYDNLSRKNLDRFRKYFVTNILIACYAKIGGAPWVVHAGAPGRPEVTIGVATTAVPGTESNERYIGISTIFRENGAFALWDITPPEQNLDTYSEKLELSVIRAIETFELRENRKVTRIACHVSGKRAGRRESDAIARALNHFTGRTIAADIVHITDDSSLWLMDGRDASHLPEPGILTQLNVGGTTALMHTEGRGSGSRFLTRPLKLTVHTQAGQDECLNVYQHLYDLRWMGWRGVRTSSSPVSVEYPRRMARLLAYLHSQEEVEALEILPGLKTKAWFL